MLKIEVVMQALAWPQREVELVRRAVAPNDVGQARLDDVEESNQTFAHVVAFGERAGEFFLAQRRRVQVAHWPVLAGGKGVGRSANAIAQCARIRAEVLQEHTRLAQVTLHEAWLIKPAQARAEPQPIKAGDYPRDIRAVLRQKLLHAAAMMTPRFPFHTARLSSSSRRFHPRLRRQPR